MLVREYLERLDKYERVTFLIARAVKDDNTPFYHFEYKDCPIWSSQEWLEGNSKYLEYHIANHKQPPIDWLGGSNWGGWYNKGALQCLLIVSTEQLEIRYSKEQAAETIEWLDRDLREALAKEKAAQ